MPGWRVTGAQRRAVLLGLALFALGVALRRPDALVLGAPLLLVGLWALALRPTRAPALRAGLAHASLREGQATRWSASFEAVDGLEHALVVVPRSPHLAFHPSSAALVVDRTTASEIVLDVELRSLRWGDRDLGEVVVGAVGLLGGYDWRPPPVRGGHLVTVPLPADFTVRAPVPRPDGLVGQNRSTHPGEGGELSDIRPFRTGDRLRRVHWPVSLRTGSLHVTAMHADQDTEVALLVDAMNDIGLSEGIEGRSSSLDHGVRAAGAMAEHYLRTGERVSLMVLGTREAPVRARAGKAHLRRVLETLARVEPADATLLDERRLIAQLRHPVSPGALVVVLTPMASTLVLAHAVSLARRGQSVVVVDTLPQDVARPDLDAAMLGTITRVENPRDRTIGSLAWRLRLLEREREMDHARAAGVPVVPWRGPQTLDQVLRDLGRRSGAPRVTAR